MSQETTLAPDLSIAENMAGNEGLFVKRMSDEAKLIGDRIYLFVLLADEAGEAEIHVLATGTAPSSAGSL